MEKRIILTNHAEEQSNVYSLGVPVQEITFQSPEIEKGVDSNMHLILQIMLEVTKKSVTCNNDM